MHRKTLGAPVLIALALGLAGCATSPAPVSPTPPVSAPETKPAPPPGPTLDPREERQLTKDLLRDVAEYYRLLREKNVEQASGYVLPEQRRAYQDDLWDFVARYRLESADVASYQLFPQPDGVMAKVKVVRTLFEKASVVPQRSELWMTWRHASDRWILVPQQKK
ncbi:MAG: hypothetical protein IH608_04815 [Proteobacteria bacterium]|nr:hypothetical protein [Pseudomonadota bacterium]